MNNGQLEDYILNHSEPEPEYLYGYGGPPMCTCFVAVWPVVICKGDY